MLHSLEPVNRLLYLIKKKINFSNVIKLRSLTWEEYSGLSDGPGLTQKSAQDEGRCVLGLEGSVTMNPRVDGWRGLQARACRQKTQTDSTRACRDTHPLVARC